ncbi:MAG: Bax inhibitor-1/YccA family protein [Actinomycetia bacterium]|nr:Bax inhibitor-1/YccA family protein [Actinomycetes bacterium]
MTMSHSSALSSGNPAFNSESVAEYLAPSQPATATMTAGGTAFKTLILLALVVVGGTWGWASATEPVAVDIGSGTGNTTVTIPGGFWLVSIGALLVGFFVSMHPRRAAIGGSVYALLEGYVLGAISAAYDAQTEGIVGAAVLATGCVFTVALVLYATRIVRPSQRMAFGVTAALCGLVLLYLFVGVLSIFNWGWLYSDQFQAIGAVVSGLAVILAALSLTLDFARIERGVATGAPKFMEWYSAYGLMVTLVWLYLEMLRLLAWVFRARG